MVFYIGSFQFVPVMALLLVLLQLAGLVALWSVLLGALFDGDINAWAPALGTFLALVGGMGWRARRRARRRPANGAITLAAIGASDVVTRDEVGNKSWVLGQLVAAGFPVPAGLVLTATTCARLAAGDPAAAIASLPRASRKALRRFLAKAGGAVIARSTFPGEDGEHLYAGVYESIPDLDPRRPATVVEGIRATLASATGAVAESYRERYGLGSAPPAAVLLQVQVDADSTGLCMSRGPDGRGDRLLIEYGTPDGEPKRVHWDLVDRVAHGETAAAAADAGDPWISDLGDFTLRIEALLGGPVQVEFAVRDGDVSLLQARRVSLATARRTWVAEGPVELDRTGQPALIRDLRGGLSHLQTLLSAPAASLGLSVSLTEDDLIVRDGVSYVSADAVRGLLGGDRVARRGGSPLRALRGLVGRVSPHALAPAPERRGDEPPAKTLARVEAWRDAHFLPTSLAQAHVILRMALIRRTLDTLRSRPAGASPVDLARPVRRLLERRFSALAGERESLRDQMARAEASVVATVESLIASAGEPISEYVAAEGGPAHFTFGALEALFSGQPPIAPAGADSTSPLVGALGPARWYDPPLEDPAALGTDGPTRPGRALSAGVFRGPLVRAAGSDPSFAAGAVVLVPDGSPRWYPWLLGAGAAVIQTGGFLSHLATAAMEAGIPAVLCADPSVDAAADGCVLTVDGDRGVVVVDA